jgi:hypothetical protein
MASVRFGSIEVSEAAPAEEAIPEDLRKYMKEYYETEGWKTPNQLPFEHSETEFLEQLKNYCWGRGVRGYEPRPAFFYDGRTHTEVNVWALFNDLREDASIEMHEQIMPVVFSGLLNYPENYLRLHGGCIIATYSKTAAGKYQISWTNRFTMKLDNEDLDAWVVRNMERINSEDLALIQEQCGGSESSDSESEKEDSPKGQ